MSETRICANCGAEHPIEDMFEVEGDWLCEDCADRLTVICDHCAERVYEENAVEDDTHTLCDHCFDEYYVRCEDCNRIIHRDRAYWDNDDNAYCASCWDEHCEVIHEYSYTPDLVFHGKGLRHFGVELEIDDGGTVNSNAQKLLDIANKDAENLYIKTDGSLDEGLELVTHPMTLEYHSERNAMGRSPCVKPGAWGISAMRQELAAFMFTSPAWRSAVLTSSRRPRLPACCTLSRNSGRSCCGSAAAPRVPDESLGGTVWHSPHAVRADEPRKEFLRRTLHGGQSHERGYR